MDAVTARDVMSREFVGVSEGDHVDEVLELMVEEEADDVLVLRGSDPVGVVSTHDVLAAVTDEDASEPTVESLMRPPPDTVDAGSDLSTVLATLSAVDADQLPVANGEQELVGVVTDADVITAATSMVSEPREEETAGVAGSHSVTEPMAGTGSTTPSGSVDESARANASQLSTQGVCESCGTLTAELQVHNGQSKCPECRDV